MTTCERTKGKKNSDFTKSHSRELLVEKNGYGHPANRPEQKENQPVKIVPKRRPKLLILKKLFVVRQSDELLFDRNPVPVEKTKPKGLKDGDDHVDRKDDRRRSEKKPRRQIVAADSTPSSRLDNTRLAGRALRIHVIFRTLDRHCELAALEGVALFVYLLAAFLSLKIRCSTLSSRFKIWSIRSGKAMNS